MFKSLYYFIICLLGFQLLFSCDIQQEYKTEESIFARMHTEKKDSIQGLIKDLDNRGTDARNTSNYKEALNLHFRALHFAELVKDTASQIYILNNIGTDLRRTYSNIEASTYHYLALELSANNPEHLKSRARAMNGLGNIFLVLKKKEQARSYFDRALAIEKETDSNLGQAINYANIGETYNMSNDLDSALYYYNESLKQNGIIDSDIGKAICKRAMGLIYIKEGKKNQGLKLLREAFLLMEDSEDAFHKIEVKIALAEALINFDALNEAEIHALKILELSKSIDSYECQQRAYGVLAKLREKQQLYRLAYQNKEKAFMYRDSVLAQNNEVRIFELENRYKGKESEQQIQLLTAERNLTEKNRINLQRNFLLLTIMFIAFIGFLYYRYYNKLKISRELEKINDIKSKFFGNISHEFRTPLTLIKAPLEKWLEKEMPAEQEKDARIMLRNSEILLFLVDQLLSLSRVDSGSFQINPQYADPSLAINGVGDFFSHIANERSLNFEINIEKSGKQWIDLHIIEMIVTNLLSNALKFTKVNGNISFIGKNDIDAYIVKVANSSKPFTHEELSKLFVRFYTKGPSHYSGTGIGLSLVKELCSLYGAKISVVYNENKEIEFTVCFPSLKPGMHQDVPDLALEKLNVDRFQILREGSSLAKSKDAVNQIFENHEKSSSNKPLLLVVEDNDDLRNYILDSFKDICRTVAAKDGEEGISVAMEYIPDIIITDIMMPKIDGLELCNTLKTDPTTNHIPIIILTALHEERDLLAGLENKADDYITKPFGTNILKQKVKNLIEVRDVLSQKYRKELIIKPLNLLIPSGEDNFARILQYVIENEITNPDFGVDDFCSIAAMSHSQLYRKLKATLDMSVSEFIRVHRIKLASELFKNIDLNVTDVCFESGFTDTSYFSKSFKEVFLVPPAEYRKKLHAEMAAIKN